MRDHILLLPFFSPLVGHM